jgi:Domain of unknown function (DUF1929)/Kelch motif/Galactose oxidase, central domain
MDEGWQARRISRRTVLGAAALAPVSGAVIPSRALAATDPAAVGQWAAPFDMGGIAIHATLLHNDDILFFQYVEGSPTTDHTSFVGTYNWRTGALREAPLPYDRDVFCAGHNSLADGRLFIAGGHAHNTGKKQDPVGVRETDIYDPIARTWTPTPPLGVPRWYPTAVGLPNGKSLIFGGTQSNGAAAPTVDEYDASTNTMRTLGSTATKTVGGYPRLLLVSNGRIVKGGTARNTAWFNPSTSSWSNIGAMLYGSRSHGAVALLSGAQSVLTVGGGAPTKTAEILDTSQATPRWRYTGSMTYARMLSNTVVLPDGKVLIVGGGQAFKYTNPVRTPEMWDPATETWTPMAPQQAGRMYHATALLLPDGRVFSAGQDNGPLARFAEIFSPPYLFRGARPTISGAPASLAHGTQLQFSSPDAASIARLVLIRPGSNTHEIDTEQRSVPLTFSVSGTTVSAQVPTNINLLPPGYYMLFVVNTTGVPAIAPWVHIG